jgi:alpha-tubulin suppressor-like RCC1 family protein
MAFDSSGDLWAGAVGSGAPAVVEFTPDQLKQSGTPTPAKSFEVSGSLNGMAFDASGDVWLSSASGIAEYTADQLEDPSSIVAPEVTIASGGTLGGLAFDGSGDLWVASPVTDTVTEYAKAQLSQSGSPAPAVILSSLDGSLNGPSSVAFDGDGDLWVANQGGNSVVEFETNQLEASGSPAPADIIGGSATSISAPDAIAIARAPIERLKPSIDGTPEQGETLRARPGEWTGIDPVRYSYLWQRCNSSDAQTCNPIVGATSDTYTVTSEDVSYEISVTITATDKFDDQSAKGQVPPVGPIIGQGPSALMGVVSYGGRSALDAGQPDEPSRGALSGVTSLASNGFSYCARLASGAVDCWGYGEYGQLGDGKFHQTGNQGTAAPVPVEGVGGVGTLSGVASLASDVYGYCALLTSGEVDCWGDGFVGQLGDGTFYAGAEGYGSAVPVQVEGIGGSGVLSGVASLVNDDDGYSMCAVLLSGGVDCWGYGYYGQLGNGQLYTTGNSGSAVPVAVAGVGDTGTLSEVESVTSQGYGYCALLATGGVDCWGDGSVGQLGDGQFYDSGSSGSAVPVPVVGVGGLGVLSGVSGLNSSSNSVCAVLTSGGVDCWGSGPTGDLGDGTFYSSGHKGSAVPAPVEGVGGVGTLSGVTSLASGFESYCAVVGTAGVDCWGYGYYGQMGDGEFYSSGSEGSPFPVSVEGVGGSGTLSEVTALASDFNGYCALLSSDEVDCWGTGNGGELGDGQAGGSSEPGCTTRLCRTTDWSAVPVPVVGVGDTGVLGGVAGLTGNGYGTFGALLTSGRVDNWGYGSYGQLGDGVFYMSVPNGSDAPQHGSAVPVQVKRPLPTR